MSKKCDKSRIRDPFLDRRTKLLPCQKEMIVWWGDRGLSQRKIAAMFNISRRSVIFILDPKRLERNMEARRERGGSKQYYDKDKHKAAMRSYRRFKKDVLNNSE